MTQNGREGDMPHNSGLWLVYHHPIYGLFLGLDKYSVPGSVSTTAILDRKRQLIVFFKYFFLFILYIYFYLGLDWTKFLSPVWFCVSFSSRDELEIGISTDFFINEVIELVPDSTDPTGSDSDIQNLITNIIHIKYVYI